MERNEHYKNKYVIGRKFSLDAPRNRFNFVTPRQGKAGLGAAWQGQQKGEKMQILRLRIKGAVLMQHSVKLADPLSEGAKALKEVSSLRKKTEDNFAEMSDLEMRYGMYHDDKIGPYIPGLWMDSAIVSGGKLNKLGAKIKRSVIVLEDKIALEYDGPRDIEALISSPQHRDVRAVTIGQAKVMRTRPVFHDWSAEFTVQYDEEAISEAEIMQSITNCGKYVGIGDFRPRFGRFEAEKI